MPTSRMEAFSDAVIAIIITIMVLELTIPHEAGWRALRPLVPKFLTYLLSFVFLGNYWNNHHHLIHSFERANGKILWANLHLLVLVIADAICYRMDGREQFRAGPYSRIRSRPASSRHRVLHPAVPDPRDGAPGLTPSNCPGKGREREDLTALLHGGNPDGVPQPLDRHRPVCVRGAGPRQTNRIDSRCRRVEPGRASV